MYFNPSHLRDLRRAASPFLAPKFSPFPFCPPPPPATPVIVCSHLRDLMADDARCMSLIKEAEGMYIDFSRQRITAKTIDVRSRGAGDPKNGREGKGKGREETGEGRAGDGRQGEEHH